jgi:hypothetical protein
MPPSGSNPYKNHPGLWRRRESPRAVPLVREEEDWRKKLQFWLALAGAVVAIATPALYAAGTQYNSVYLNAFGVPQDLFPKQFQEYVTLGVIAFAFSVGKLTGSLWDVFVDIYPLLVFIIILAKVWVWTDDESNAPAALSPKWRARLQARSPFIFAFEALVHLPIATYATAILVVGVAVLAALLPFQIGIELGKQSALDAIAKRQAPCANSERNSPSCVEITKDGKVLARGSIIVASEKFIAVHTAGTTTIFENKDLLIRATATAKAGR